MENDLVVEGEAVLPGGVEHAEIGIRDGVIAEIRKAGSKGRRIDASGCLVFPGFIDAHVHLREPGWERKEDFVTGSLAAARGGVTTVLDMPNTPEPATTVQALRRKKELASKATIEVLPYAGVTASNLGSLGALGELAVGFMFYLAKTTGSLVYPDERLREALEAVSKTGKPAAIHCEDQASIEAREGSVGKGAVDFRGHGLVRDVDTEVRSVKKALAAASETGAMVDICHVSARRTLDEVAAARVKGGVVCEATLHHLFFTADSAESKGELLRVNPPLRSEADRSSLVEGLRNGVVDFLVTDHAPHLIEEKRSDPHPSGVPGLDNYGNMVAWLLNENGFGPRRIASVASGNQSRFFGLNDRGQIAVGKRGDLAVLDARLKEVVKAEALMTKCGWSPYEGEEFSGRVRWTIRGGDVLLDDCQIVS